ncbi:MAG: hypothetical protein HC908_11830 [Calothrix sp. SM1_7_51]|nr:hypothetical protein [Calothrix sp. SM1_7_51]
MAGAPKGNKNAEKWTLKEATEVFTKALELAKNDKYDFLGELARDMGVSRHLFGRLVEKFPELEEQYELISSTIEANCFEHGKKGDINTAIAIVNLKSNYQWTDRLDQTTKGEKVSSLSVILQELDGRTKSI